MIQYSLYILSKDSNISSHLVIPSIQQNVINHIVISGIWQVVAAIRSFPVVTVVLRFKHPAAIAVEYLHLYILQAIELIIHHPVIIHAIPIW